MLLCCRWCQSFREFGWNCGVSECRCDNDGENLEFGVVCDCVARVGEYQWKIIFLVLSPGFLLS